MMQPWKPLSKTQRIFLWIAPQESVRVGFATAFFTSRTEFELTGKSLVERNFLENFLLPDSFSYIPDGMLPMCYPSDHNDGTYIHNWAMWYVLELNEYLKRTGDTELIEKAKNRVYKLLDFTNLFENEDGFLSRLKC